MKNLLSCLLLLIPLLLSGCATPFGALPQPGTPQQDVVARMGTPAHRYQYGDQTLLEYPGGYYGQQTYMAHIGPDGRLIDYEQVRTVEKFGAIKINEATKADVLRTVGTPSETSWLSLPQLEVWSYRYKENNIWNSMMHIEFDRSGVVRKVENGRDPLYDNSESRK
jgi:outer membrane protein assembly factor BamE (lipoprotein component of BamABCDE complex)